MGPSCAVGAPSSATSASAVALTPVVAEQDETCVYVFGANVGAAPDAATAKLAKRVLQISVVLIILQAIIAVVYYVRDEPLALILITLCFSLAHPTCGIFGVMNKDRSLLCMFCGYGCIQCAADAITCVLCIVYAVSKSGKKRRDFAMLAAYYFVQGVIHYVVFYWGNKLYIHKGFDARAVHPEARAERRRREPVPVAATSRLEDDGFAALPGRWFGISCADGLDLGERAGGGRRARVSRRRSVRRGEGTATSRARRASRAERREEDARLAGRHRSSCPR